MPALRIRACRRLQAAEKPVFVSGVPSPLWQQIQPIYAPIQLIRDIPRHHADATSGARPSVHPLRDKACTHRLSPFHRYKAATCGVSSWSLELDFVCFLLPAPLPAGETGMAPLEYVHTLRLEEAKANALSLLVMFFITGQNKCASQ